MKYLIVLVSLISFATSGVIHGLNHNHHQATSFQSIQMEHFHAVPTYMKKEDMYYLEHPVSEGKTHSKIEVHHGSMQDPGYAVANIHSDFHGHNNGRNFISVGRQPSRYGDHEDVKQLQLQLNHNKYSEEDAHEQATPQQIHDEQPEQQQHESREIEEEEDSGEGISDNTAYHYQGEDGQDSYERSREDNRR